MHRRLIAPGALAASLLLAIPASAAELLPRGAGHRRPLLPGLRQRRIRRLPLRPAAPVPAGDGRAGGHGDPPGHRPSRISRASTWTSCSMSARCGSTARRRRSPRPASTSWRSPRRRRCAKGTTVTVVVRYSGVPSSKIRRTASPAGTALRTAASAANEPEAAWWWFPSNDHPLDKATYDVSVAVPDGTQAISNGVLQSTSSRARLDALQLAVQQAAGHVSRHARGRQVRHHDRDDGERPADRQRVQQGPGRQLRARRARASSGPARSPTGSSEYFGPYPFNALGGYVPNTDTGYALETQTRPFYSPRQFANGVERVRRRARAGPPVVRRQRVRRPAGRTSGSTRASPATRSGCGRSTRARARRRSSRTTCTPSHPADDPFWTVKPGRSGSGEPVPHRRVRPRGAGHPGAAQRDRGRRVLRRS